MMIFGVALRFLLVGLAVLIERVGAFLRENPLVQSFIASPPEGFEGFFRREREEGEGPSR